MAEEVIDEILWTDLAKLTFDKIIYYLQTNWTDKEVQKFISQTTKLLSNIKRYPEMCRPSQKRKNTRIAVLNKHTQLVYHYKPGQKNIVILLFWNFKQDPSKFYY